VFCPKCRQEFEAFAELCPDCEISLADSLEPGAAGAPAFQLTLVVASDVETAVLIRETLAPTGIPVGDVETDAKNRLPGDSVGLLLPYEFTKTALGAIDANPGLTRGLIPLDEGDPAVFVKQTDPTDGPEVALDMSLLTLTPAQLVTRGTGVIVSLLEFVRIGDDAARDHAIRGLRAFGPEGLSVLARQLAVLARELREASLYQVVREIREKLTDSSALEDLIAVVADGRLPTGSRTLGLHALGRLELKDVHPHLIPLLADPDPIVREEADEALCTLSDEDMGFDPDMDPAEVAATQERWRSHFSG